MTGVKMRRTGIGCAMILIPFFIFSPLFQIPALPEDLIKKNNDDPFHPPLMHDSLRFSLARLNEDFTYKLSIIDEEIKKLSNSIVSETKRDDRDALMSELLSLENKRAELIITTLNAIGDLRLIDMEKTLTELVVAPPKNVAERPRVLLASASPLDLFSPEAEFGGYLKLRLSGDLYRDNDYEDIFESHLNAFVKMKYPVSDRLSFFISARGEYDYMTGGSSHYDYEVSLEEAYLDIMFGLVDIRIGNQIITWGRTDVVNPTDNINALDLTKLITGETDERKISTFAIKIDYYIKNTSLDLVVIPFFQEYKYDPSGSDWALFKPGNFGTYAGSYLPFANYLDESSLDLLYPMQGLYASPAIPQYSPKNVQGGGRISSKFGGWDFSVSYLNVFDKYPTATLSEGLRNAVISSTLSDYLLGLDPDEYTEQISLDYLRYHVIGFDFATTWGSYGFRGEMGLFLNRATYTSDLKTTDNDYIQYVLGIDRIFGDNLYINVQFIEKIILDYRKEFIEDEIQNSLTLYAYDKFLDDRLIPEVRVFYNVNGGDFLITPKITYKYTDTLEFSLGFTILEGDPDTVFGYYSNNDQVFFDIKYYF